MTSLLPCEMENTLVYAKTDKAIALHRAVPCGICKWYDSVCVERAEAQMYCAETENDKRMWHI